MNLKTLTFFSLLLISISARAEELADLDPHWLAEGHIGFVGRPLDNYVDDEWEHQGIKSHLIRVGAYRMNHLNKTFFMMYGGNFRYSTSVDTLGGAKIETEGYSLSPEIRFGLYFPIKDLGLRGYGYLNYAILKNYSSKLKSLGFNTDLNDSAKEGVWALNMGLGLSLPLFEGCRGILSYDLVLGATTGGVSFEF